MDHTIRVKESSHLRELKRGYQTGKKCPPREATHGGREKGYLMGDHTRQDWLYKLFTHWARRSNAVPDREKWARRNRKLVSQAHAQSACAADMGAAK